MSTKAQIKTQAKASATPVAAHIPQPPVAVPEHGADRPDMAAQLEGAARLGHSLGAFGVDCAGPPILQRQEIPEEEEKELQMKQEPAALQRQELPEEEEEEELQMKREPAAVQRQELPEEEEEELMMRRDDQRVGPQGGPVPPDVEAAIRRARGGGQPLEGVLQEQMSASLGHDFSGVRVHTDSEADALNQQLQAKAFTTGPDIFFKCGAYAPSTRSGRELLAHELTHVVQQGTGRVRGDGSAVTARAAGDALEQEAAALARQAATAGRGGGGAGGDYEEGAARGGTGRGGRGTHSNRELPAIVTETGRVRWRTDTGIDVTGSGQSSLEKSGGPRRTPIIQRWVNPYFMLPEVLPSQVAGAAGDVWGAVRGADRRLRLTHNGNIVPALHGLSCSQAVAIAKHDANAVLQTQQTQAALHRPIWRPGRWRNLLWKPFMAVAIRTPGTEVSFWDGGTCRHIGVASPDRGQVRGYNQVGYVEGGGGFGQYNSNRPTDEYEIRAE